MMMTNNDENSGLLSSLTRVFSPNKKRCIFFFLLLLFLNHPLLYECEGFMLSSDTRRSKVLSTSSSATLSSSSSSSSLKARINFDNFWVGTIANFTSIDEAPNRDPDFISNSGSKYWNINDGKTLIRQSDHWSGQHGCYRIVDCQWYLDRSIDFEEISVGSCNFNDFGRIKRKGRKTLKERGIIINDQKDKGVQLIAQPSKIGFHNFWRSTEASYVEYEVPKDREPEFESKSGSKYWDDGDGVIRLSDHWTGQYGVSKIVDCYWTIDKKQTWPKHEVSGKCLYDNFLKRRKQSGGKRKKSRRNKR